MLSKIIKQELIEGDPLNPDFSTLDKDSPLWNIYSQGIDSFYNLWAGFTDQYGVVNATLQRTIYEDYADINSLVINPYTLEGIRSIVEESDNVVKITTKNGRVFASTESGSYTDDDIYKVENEDYSFSMYATYSNKLPRLQVSIAVKNDELSMADVLFNEFGKMALAFTNNIVTQKVEDCDSIELKLNQYTFFNMDASIKLKFTEMLSIVDSLISKDIISNEDLLAIDGSNFIYKENQVEDDSFYKIYSDGVTGKVIINNEDRSVDLSNISIKVKNSDLLVKGLNYTLVAYLVDEEGNRYLLDQDNKEYQVGEELVLTLHDNVGLNINNYGKYNIACYLCNGDDNRISSLYYPDVEGEDSVYVMDDKSIYRFDDETNYIIHSKEAQIDKDINVGTTETYVSYNAIYIPYADLTNTGFSVSNNDFILEGDDIEYNIYLVNGETKELVYCESMTYGATTSGVYGTKIDSTMLNELEAGEYVLQGEVILNETLTFNIDDYAAFGYSSEYVDSEAEKKFNFNVADGKLSVSVEDVDLTPPTIELKEEFKDSEKQFDADATIASLLERYNISDNKGTYELKVYYFGQEVTDLSTKLVNGGDYKLVATDPSNNVTEYLINGITIYE